MLQGRVSGLLNCRKNMSMLDDFDVGNRDLGFVVKQVNCAVFVLYAAMACGCSGIGNAGVLGAVANGRVFYE